MQQIPYGRQTIDDADIAAVVEVLQSDWLTTGPAVPQFEDSFRTFVDAKHGVAVSSGTAALHLAMLAAGLGPGDEAIVPTMTFAASANAVRFAGARVVFADVRDDTLTVDTADVERLITERTKVIVAVDYAGVPCDLDELTEIADRRRITLIEDACHAPGAEYRGRRVGGISHLSCFSFHPVKHITTGEGGMVTTDDPELAARVRRLRNHGIDSDFRQRERSGTWEYDMVELGYNYRLSDINCALGTAQVRRLPEWIQRRQVIADRYSKMLSQVDNIRIPVVPEDRTCSWHLYPVRLISDQPSETRSRAFDEMRANGIGVNVHYKPVHLHSYYRQFGHGPGDHPIAEAAYQGLLSLPMWPGLSESDQDRVIDLLARATS